MDKEAEYASDSDESDEDFCPEDDSFAGDSDVESAEDEEDCDAEGTVHKHPEQTKNRTQKSERNRKKLGKKVKARKQKRELNNDNDDDDDNEPNEAGESTRRNTRHMEATANSCAKAVEKDELNSDEEEAKSRTDALWADFLSDVKPVAAKKSVNERNKGKKSIEADLKPGNVEEIAALVPEKKIIVTEVLDFAGEEVKVQKTVSADSIKENKTSTTAKPALSGNSVAGHSPVVGLKRPGAAMAASSSAGLGSILNQIGKKKKISVLEKTKLDWNSFKQCEGIEEELQTFNKGKDGYLERQDFLQRTDLRQFEIEKNLRQSRRKN